VHRDLKPANVMLASEPGGLRAVLTDFGIAHVCDEPEDGRGLLGSPAYMAPEQAGGAPATVASDIFAFGVLLHEMATGRRPFAPRTRTRIPGQPLPVVSVSRELDPSWRLAVLRCLALAPGARFARASDVVAALGSSGSSGVRRLRPVSWTVILAISAVAIGLGVGLAIVERRTEPAVSVAPDAVTVVGPRGSDPEVGTLAPAMTRRLADESG
jgi:serine/threonine protein kinase, bacterial